MHLKAGPVHGFIDQAGIASFPGVNSKRQMWHGSSLKYAYFFTFFPLTIYMFLILNN
jgi:hypothetical protein